MKKIILLLIKAYQSTLSLDHGFRGKLTNKRVCIYRPTCSVYCYEAIDKHGVLKGGKLGFRRVKSCHPYSKRNRYDPVP